MKKMTATILPGIAFILFVSWYLKYDKKAYNYGLHYIFCHKDIPYGLKPKFNSDYPRRFVMLDDDDYELVDAGFKYEPTSFEINRFTGYGYNGKSVIIKCTDSLNDIKYLISYETGYKSDRGNREISFKDLNVNDFDLIRSKYKWVELNIDDIGKVRFRRTLFLVGAFVSMSFVVWKLLKLFKVRR